MPSAAAPPADPSPAGVRRSVALVTLGCARNEVDSEELAGRLDADGWDLAPEAADADVVLVNTCGFIEAAKKDSVDTLLEAADLKLAGRTRAVVAVGCMAERYGEQLAAALPEADAVLSFDDYAQISSRLGSVLSGHRPAAHVPSDRRLLLPLSPVERRGATVALPGHAAPSAPSAAALPEGLAPASGPRPMRRRLGGGPVAPLKIASGCDRRCSFCAIPSFRGAYVSRPPEDVMTEARWLAGEGVRELVLVSENSTSYGKDLGDLTALEALLPRLAAIEGVERVRVSYLQPAEVRPSLVEVLTSTAGVAAYADLSFQHSAPGVLRRMRRFGDTDRFLALLDRFRARAPRVGVRSNVIVGFPGETEADLDELERFLGGARLDVVGVFGYSEEEGTEAAGLDGALPAAEVRARVARVSSLVEELTAQRAEERVGEDIVVLVEDLLPDGRAEGRAEHQGPEVDGTTTLDTRTRTGSAGRIRRLHVGDVVPARAVAAEGVDLVARALVPAAR